MGICENQRPNKANKGQVLVLVALSLVVIIGFAALAIDVAYFYHTKHQLQGAADAAALAGAADLDGTLDAPVARTKAVQYAGLNEAAKSSVLIESDGSNTLNMDNDITVGYWNDAAKTYTPGITPANAIQVRTRRTDASSPLGGSPGGPVNTFFGKIFGIDTVNRHAEAIARSGLINLAPIAIDEYWMNDGTFNPNTGEDDCDNPRNPNIRTGPQGRAPYGIHHVYPNSFARPPCSAWLYADADNSDNSGNMCTNPTNGNINQFPAKSCDPNNSPNVDDSIDLISPNGISPNGPLTVDCTTLLGTDLYACTGRPMGKPRASRVFPIVGLNAKGINSDELRSIVDLDYRINTSDGTGQWYRVAGSTFFPEPNSDSQRNKDIAAGYIESGAYPNITPTSAIEFYRPQYYIINPPYTSSEPYASVSFFSGQGTTKQLTEVFYDNGNYQGGKYAPGKKIIVAVYDGIVGGSGNQSRTTIVGFARVTIFGYGKNLGIDDASGYPYVITGPASDLTIYGYIEDALNDSLKQNVTDFSYEGGGSGVRLVR